MCLGFDHKNELVLIHTGLAYMDDKRKCKLLLPTKYARRHFMAPIFRKFSMLDEYDTGAALEFFFHSLYLSEEIQLKCHGVACYSITGSTKLNSEVCLKCQENIVQKNIDKDLDIKPNQCTLIKLVKGHFAIDFLIVDKTKSVGIIDELV